MECVLCDWTLDWLAPSRAAYPAGAPLGHPPFRFDGTEIRQCRMSEGLAETMPDVALAAHWAEAHGGLFLMMAGPYEVRMM